MKKKEWCMVECQEKIAAGIYSLWLETPSIAEQARPGQFVSLYCKDGSRLLPRSISLCEIDRKNRRLRLVYQVVGKGTLEFSTLKTGEQISVLGPLGNGFPLEEAAGTTVFLMGGGIGIAPILESAKQLQAEKRLILGYRNECFLLKEFEKVGTVYTATENGSFGIKGNVLDAVREQELSAEVIFACGPTSMLRAVKQYAERKSIPCWISIEEKMACGIGACLACVCRSREVDRHSHVHNKRICKDGPVFEASEVEL